MSTDKHATKYSPAMTLDTPVARDAAALPPPVVLALRPASAAVGDPSFSLRVVGTGFDAASVIVFAGQDEPTTFINENELSTGMNMPLWQGPDSLPVLVRNADGQASAPVTFTMLPPREVPLNPAHASLPNPVIHQITPM